MTAVSLPGASTRASAAERLLIFAIGFNLALMLPSCFAYALDERILNGINIWFKPLKFQLSLIMTLGTAILLLPLLDEQRRASLLVRLGAFAMSFCAVAEIAYITLQSARGRGSHFNFATDVERIAYIIMGIGAVTIVAGAFAIGLAIWLSRPFGKQTGLSVGAALGLMLGAVLTFATAVPLGGGELPGQVGHWIGGDRSDASGLPFFGWSTTGGDLRVAHFFGMHTMQTLPLLGLLADRAAPGRARLMVLVGAALCVAVTAVTFLEALAGKPFIG